MFTRITSMPSTRNATAFRYPCGITMSRPLQALHITDNRDVGFNNAYHPTSTSIRNYKAVSWRKRSIAIKKRLRQAEQRYKKPGQIQAISMPLSPQEMDNTMLVVLSQMGVSSHYFVRSKFFF